jgi:hypothetical protein
MWELYKKAYGKCGNCGLNTHYSETFDYHWESLLAILNARKNILSFVHINTHGLKAYSKGDNALLY